MRPPPFLELRHMRTPQYLFREMWDEFLFDMGAWPRIIAHLMFLGFLAWLPK